MKSIIKSKHNSLVNSVLVISLSAVLGLAGCQKEGAGEKAGKKIDQAAENAKQTIEQSTDAAKQKIAAAKDTLDLKTDQAGAALNESTDAAKATLTQAGKQVERSTENAEHKIEQVKENAGKELDIAKESVVTKAETAESYVDDSVITLKVKAAILDEATLNASKFEVSTVNGVVTLSGTVDSEQSKAKAIDLVKSQEHVKAVQADLIVNVSTLSK
jgi:hyperosmotically inducible periplasmic protein